MIPSVESSSKSWAPKFFLIWSGQALSLLGSSLVQFALVWWITKESGSATILATASLVALLPQIVLGPFIGPLVDRHDRRLIMIAADASVAAATTVLMLLFALGVAEIWHVFAILLVRSLGGAFHHPAMASSTSLLVPERHLTRVGGLNQALQGAMSIAAPPVGALLVMALPTQGVLAIDLATALAAILPLLFVSIPSPPRAAARGDGAAQPAVTNSYREDLVAGLRYVVEWPGLFGLILLAMLLNFLLVPSSSLLPLVVTKAFGKGALELAWTETSFGVGIILGGLLLSAWGGFKRRIRTSILGIVGIGAGVALTGLVPGTAFPLLLTASALIGFSQVFANGPLHAIFQSSIAPDMQGRVFSLISAGATAMMPLSLLVAGPVSDRLGVRVWYVAGGVLCIIAALAGTAIPAIMNIEENGKGKADEGRAGPAGGDALPAVPVSAPEADSER
jgi:DHA3 family macrolide efflux protein-like MFS transporter